MSSVIQNGPAFFERTWTASSPTVVAGSGPGHRSDGRAKQLAGVLDIHDVVEHELVRGPALDLRRRGGERVARHVDSTGERQVKQQRVGGLRDGRCGLLLT